VPRPGCPRRVFRCVGCCSSSGMLPLNRQNLAALLLPAPSGRPSRLFGGTCAAGKKARKLPSSPSTLDLPNSKPSPHEFPRIPSQLQRPCPGFFWILEKPPEPINGVPGMPTRTPPLSRSLPRLGRFRVPVASGCWFSTGELPARFWRNCWPPCPPCP
jgi:hypothetical protein